MVRLGVGATGCSFMCIFMGKGQEVGRRGHVGGEYGTFSGVHGRAARWAFRIVFVASWKVNSR